MKYSRRPSTVPRDVLQFLLGEPEVLPGRMTYVAPLESFGCEPQGLLPVRCAWKTSKEDNGVHREEGPGVARCLPATAAAPLYKFYIEDMLKMMTVSLSGKY